MKSANDSVNLIGIIIAAGVLLSFAAQGEMSTLPPQDSIDLNQWNLAWSDEFNYANAELDKNWESQNGPSGHILCSRWRVNCVVDGGILKIINKKETKAGQDWTSGNIWTKKWFKYGYFECKYKYSGAGATNNSFWLMTRGPDPSQGKRFEIDINEGHFPNEVNTNIHDWTPNNHTSSSKSFVFGITPDVNLPLEIPITTKKVRFSSNNHAHFHIREFRIYNDNDRKFPNVMSETADTDIPGLINHARASGTKLTVSGTFGPGHEKTNMVDGKVIQTSWVSQKEGKKWIEFEWTQNKTIGCIQFINGWKDSGGWNALISDYKIEYWDGSKWVVMASLDLATQDNFANVYHTYGLLWNKDEIAFYFDRKLLRREKNKFCYSAAPIYLSVAIINWSGPVTDAIDGTSMKIDYVRHYNPKPVAVKPFENVINKNGIIYLNPVTESLHFCKAHAFEHIKVFNLHGEMVMRKPLIPGKDVKVSSLPHGMYIYTLEGKMPKLSGTFIKQ